MSMVIFGCRDPMLLLPLLLLVLVLVLVVVLVVLRDDGQEDLSRGVE